MKALDTSQLPDPVADRVRRSHQDAIGELQSAPLAGARIVSNKELADGVDTQIAHGLGRAPKIVLVSVPRGSLAAGSINESRPAGTDRSKFVVLTATGYGATVTVDLVVA